MCQSRRRKHRSRLRTSLPAPDHGTTSNSLDNSVVLCLSLNSAHLHLLCAIELSGQMQEAQKAKLIGMLFLSRKNTAGWETTNNTFSMVVLCYTSSHGIRAKRSKTSAIYMLSICSACQWKIWKSICCFWWLLVWSFHKRQRTSPKVVRNSWAWSEGFEETHYFQQQERSFSASPRKLAWICHTSVLVTY